MKKKKNDEERVESNGEKVKEKLTFLFTVGDCSGMMMKKSFYSFGLFHFVELIKFVFKIKIEISLECF